MEKIGTAFRRAVPELADVCQIPVVRFGREGPQAGGDARLVCFLLLLRASRSYLGEVEIVVGDGIDAGVYPYMDGAGGRRRTGPR